MMNKDVIDRAIVTAPVLAGMAGVYFTYGLLKPGMSPLMTFLGILPLGVCLALIHDASSELWSEE